MTRGTYRSKRGAEACYWVGVLMIAAAALTAYGIGIGIGIGAFIPLPFSLAALLNPSRFNIALALASWGCWFTALGFILA